MPFTVEDQGASIAIDTEDPVLLMLGVGRQLWVGETADRFVDRLRSEDAAPPPTYSPTVSAADPLAETVWHRIGEHAGETFHTVRGLPFTFEVEGAGLWFTREGRRINRKLTRSQIEEAISRCPLTSTTEIKDLMASSYQFAVLMDRRIRRDNW